MPAHLAVASQRTQLTRAALEDAVAKAASRLRAARVTRGERVGVCVGNSPELVVVLLALAQLDCSIALIDVRGFPSLRDAVRTTRCDRLILPRATSGRTSTSADAGCPVLTAGDIAPLAPGLAPEPADDMSGGLRLDDLEHWPWVDRPDGLVLVTSGSTGHASLVAKDARRFFANLRRTHEVIGYRPDDVLAPLLPLSHQYGLSLLLIGLVLDLTVVVGPHERVLEGLRLARRFGATIVDATPQAHDVILRAVGTGRLDAEGLRAVRHWCVGGGPVPLGLQETARRLHGRVLLDGYGSTELGNVAHVRPDEPTLLRALPGVSLRVVGPDGSDLGADAWGLLLVATPDAGGGEWQSTGDLARLAGDGSLVVSGRHDAVLRNGLVVYPAAIERAVSDHGITALCVTTERRGRPHHPRIVLVVEDHLRRGASYWHVRVRSLLSPALRPDRVVVRDRLPRTPVSLKVDRKRVGDFVTVLDRGIGAADITGVPLAERVSALRRVEEHLRAERATVLRVMAGYASREAAELELEATLAALAGAEAEVVMQRPPVVPTSWVYMPSNVLLYSYALYLLVPALFTERLVARPSSRVAEATAQLHALLAEVHKLPIELVDCTQAQLSAMRGDAPGTVVFTGRYANAEEVRRTLRPGQVMLFFGQGTNPILVGPSADVELAARDAVMMRLLNSGQDCFGPDLHLVHRDVASAFLRSVVGRLEQHTLEAIVADGSDHVPVSDPLVLRDVIDHVGRHRANVRWGGRVDLRRMLVEPTVLVWDVDAAPECSEFFAPVLNIAVYDDESEVRGLLDSEFYRGRSMCASLYGTSPELASWCSERMTASIDASIVATDDPNQAFGGVGVMANYVATTDGLAVGPQLISDAVSRWFAPGGALPAETSAQQPPLGIENAPA